jgi:hypothetical protein
LYQCTTSLFPLVYFDTCYTASAVLCRHLQRQRALSPLTQCSFIQLWKVSTSASKPSTISKGSHKLGTHAYDLVMVSNSNYHISLFAWNWRGDTALVSRHQSCKSSTDVWTWQINLSFWKRRCFRRVHSTLSGTKYSKVRTARHIVNLITRFSYDCFLCSLQLSV